MELIDPALTESCCHNEVLRCIHIGLLCVQDKAIDRPTMLDIVSFLSNDTIQLAKPKQPAFFNVVVEASELLYSRQEHSLNVETISRTFINVVRSCTAWPRFPPFVVFSWSFVSNRHGR